MNARRGRVRAYVRVRDRARVRVPAVLRTVHSCGRGERVVSRSRVVKYPYDACVRDKWRAR